MANKEHKYLNGKKLCKKLGIQMWTMFDWETSYVSSFNNKLHYQVFEHLVITPLGVAVICEDDTGLFEVNRSKEIAKGEGRIKCIHNAICPSTIRFNKHWVEEMAGRAKVHISVKQNGTVGAMMVPAVSFAKEQKRSYVEVIV